MWWPMLTLQSKLISAPLLYGVAAYFLATLVAAYLMFQAMRLYEHPYTSMHTFYQVVRQLLFVIKRHVSHLQTTCIFCLSAGVLILFGLSISPDTVVKHNDGISRLVALAITLLFNGTFQIWAILVVREAHHYVSFAKYCFIFFFINFYLQFYMCRVFIDMSDAP
jgi:hypothetical protein